MAAAGQRVAVFFGGRSVEHDVSIISAVQLMAILSERHTVVPVYVARDGTWWTGDALTDVASFGPAHPAGAERVQLRLGSPGQSPLAALASGLRRRERAISIDVAICAIHGTGGEDGSLLGALEHANIPYAGGGVGASAIAMDKSAAKAVFAAAGLSVLRHASVLRAEFVADPAGTTARAIRTAGLPCYCKPASLGSSIGVARCSSVGELAEALELALELDSRALIEPSLDVATEINCAVLGRSVGEKRASLCEQPVKTGMPLTFEDKYLNQPGKTGKGNSKQAGVPKAGTGAAKTGATKAGAMASQDRIIPAPISSGLADAIRAAAKIAHAALEFAGVVRYDFLVLDAEEAEPTIYLNEANTVPGSFAFYLFEPDGLSFAALADRLIDIALAEAADRRATVRTFDSALLGLHGANR